MKANSQPRIKTDPLLERELREHALLLNLMTDGRLTGTNNATTAAPTTGDHARGDFVRNSEPSEAGSASSKYVILGFLCVTAGTPGTWVEVRALTGN
jgi:hypothetical protein